MSKLENITQIIRLNRNFNRSLKHEFHDLIKESGFTFPQLSVVSILTKYGKQKVSEISEKIGLSDSTVSGILDRLEHKGVIERERNREDRRVVKIKLSEGSHAACCEFHRKREEYFAKLLQKLSDEEIGDIVKGFQILNRVICN